MLRETFRHVAFAQHFEPHEMVAIERPRRANRKPDAMHRQRIAFAQRSELGVRRAAGAHVVLGVDLEESERLWSGENVAKMRGLEADAGTRGQTGNDGHIEVPALCVAEEARGARGTAYAPF